MAEKLYSNENEWEEIILKSSKAFGYLFPTTTEEVEIFEQYNQIEISPAWLKTGSELLTALGKRQR